MKEIWKDIRNYDGLYQVSNTGKIKSLNYRHTGREKMLKLSVNNKGYLYVILYKNGVKKFYRINRLVAEAFISNPNNYPCVNHKDENKTNNFVCINEDGTVDFKKSNLEWCDQKYNNNYGTRLERVAEKTTNGKCSKPVLQIDQLTDAIIAEFPSIREVKRQLGISHISECCLGKRNTAGGFIWKYKEESVA